jgi:putative DNA primase/helicase
MNGRPDVVVDPGRLPWVADEVEEAIRKDHAKWGLYQHGDTLVRVVTATPEDNKRMRVDRPGGAAILKPATPPMLEDIFTRAVHFQNAKLHEINCPSRLAIIYLSRAGLWKLPALTGIVSAPILRADGSILFKPGFDEETGLLLESPTNWTAPPRVSRTGVEAAVRTLLAPFAEFRLRAEAERSVIISAILTGLQRRLLYSAPMHFFDAPVQASGKSLLADCISIIVTGRRVVSTSVNNDEDELRKKLVSILRAGDAIVSLDNITRPLASDALASILTLDNYQDRILGLSQTIHLLTNAFFMATGNNLEFSLDMPSRVIGLRLEPGVENPEERTFEIPDLRAHISEHREQLVTAALIILQEYYFAGRPRQTITPCRFEQWSREIREAIVWLKLPDPYATRESVIASDPERESTLAVLGTWHAVRGESAITLADLVADFEREDLKIEGLLADLKAALLEVAADREEQTRISTRRLAAWCRARIGRIVGDFKLQKGPDARAGFSTWQVVRVRAQAPGDAAAEEPREVTKELLFN